MSLSVPTANRHARISYFLDIFSPGVFPTRALHCEPIQTRDTRSTSSVEVRRCREDVAAGMNPSAV